jgi:Thioredoxin-like
MYPHERSLVEEMKNKPFALIGVNSDQTIERAKQAIEKNGLNWRSFQNKDAGRERAIADDWAVQGWPTIVVMDQDMVIRYRGHDGNAATDVAKALVEKLAGK